MLSILRQQHSGCIADVRTGAIALAKVAFVREWPCARHILQHRCYTGNILGRHVIVGAVTWPLRHEYTKIFGVPGGGAAVSGSHDTVHVVSFRNGLVPSCPHEPLSRLLKDVKSGAGHAGMGIS
jgi:hypothetical protein